MFGDFGIIPSATAVFSKKTVPGLNLEDLKTFGSGVSSTGLALSSNPCSKLSNTMTVFLKYLSFFLRDRSFKQDGMSKRFIYR